MAILLQNDTVSEESKSHLDMISHFLAAQMLSIRNLVCDHSIYARDVVAGSDVDPENQ